jgi:hypothetical protein
MIDWTKPIAFKFSPEYEVEVLATDMGGVAPVIVRSRLASPEGMQWRTSLYTTDGRAKLVRGSPLIENILPKLVGVKCTYCVKDSKFQTRLDSSVVFTRHYPSIEIAHNSLHYLSGNFHILEDCVPVEFSIPNS